MSREGEGLCYCYVNGMCMSIYYQMGIEYSLFRRHLSSTRLRYPVEGTGVSPLLPSTTIVVALK